MRLLPHERVLTGSWVRAGADVVGDPICNRIDALIQSHLRELAKDRTGWETLYLDPEDGRLWEHTYPNSERHGGGPPELRLIEAGTAQMKYGVGLRKPQLPEGP